MPDDPTIPTTPFAPTTPPTVTIADVTEAETNFKEQAKQTTAGQKESGWFSNIWAQFWAAVADGLSVFMTQLARLADAMFALMAKFIHEAQGEGNPEFWELTGKIVEDLTGVEVDTDKLKTAFFGSGRLAAMDELGKGIFNLLAEEFLTPASEISPGLKPRNLSTGIGALPSKPISPEQGVEAARRFLGFAMSWAIREANVAVLGEMIGFGQIENFREYGAGMSRNMGLGRLMRLALRPLIDITVSQPLEWALNMQYRPKLLGPGDLRRMLALELLSEEAARDELRKQGYSEPRITALLQTAIKTVGDTDLERLVRYGHLDLNDELAELRLTGYDVRRAGFIQIGNELARADSRVNSFLGLLRSRLADGVIDFATFSEALDSLPMGQQEKKWERVTAEIEVGLPRRQLTLSQMREAFLHGTIDVTEWRAYLRRVGYSADDEKILTIELLLDAKAEAERLALKAEREAAKKAAAEAAAQKKQQQP